MYDKNIHSNAEIQLEPRNNIYGIRNYASGILRVACVKGNVAYSKTLVGGPIMCDSEPYRYLQLSRFTDRQVAHQLWFSC